MFLIINNHVVNSKKDKKIEKAKHAVLLTEKFSAQPQQRKYYQLDYLDSLENTDVMG